MTMPNTSSILGRLYWIADPSCFQNQDTFLHTVDTAIDHQIGLIQYRDKAASKSERQTVTQLIAQKTQHSNTQLIINDDLDLAHNLLQALKLSCGLHLGFNDSDIITANRRSPRPALIGASCYANLERAIEARSAGADYVSFGAFHPSKTKPEAKPAPLSILTSAKQRLDCPIVAIGGITPRNCLAILNAGADIIAVAGALNRAKHFSETLEAFKSCFNEFEKNT